MAALALAIIGLLGLARSVRAAEENKDLIVGTWEIAYSDAKKEIPVGTKFEFTAAGKVVLTVKDKDGKDVLVDAGGYKVDKDILTLTGKDGNKNDKGIICLLNKSSFIINDEVEDKVIVLKRVKAK
jgi:uncharacterized protein (TIGR03066 family)